MTGTRLRRSQAAIHPRQLAKKREIRLAAAPARLNGPVNAKPPFLEAGDSFFG